MPTFPSSVSPLAENPQSLPDDSAPAVVSESIGPAYSREKILGMGKDELGELRRKLQEGDSTVQEEYRLQIADGTFSELKSLSGQMNTSAAPEELAKLREEADLFSRQLMDDLTSTSRSPEEIESVLAGYRLEQEQAKLRADTLDEFSTDKVDALKENLFQPSGPLALLGAAGVLSFSDAEVASLQGAQSEEDFNNLLRGYTKEKTGQYFGAPTELDSDDLMLVAQEVASERDRLEKEKPTLMDKLPFAEKMKQAASAAKTLIHFNVVRKASEGLQISKGVLLRMGAKTFGDLQKMLACFDLDDPNIDPKILEMAKLRDEIESRRGDLEDALRAGIQNFQQDGFTEEARERMLANLTIDNMSITSILSYWYMDHNDRENWFTHCVSRVATFKRVQKHWWKRRNLTMARLGGLFEPQSVKNWREISNRTEFKQTFDKNGKMHVVDVLDKEIKQLSAEIDGLSDEIAKSAENNNTKAFRKTDVQAEVKDAQGNVTKPKVNELEEGLINRRDLAVQKYNLLSQKYAGHFGEMGTSLVKQGKAFDSLGSVFAQKGKKPFVLGSVLSGQELVDAKKLLVDHGVDVSRPVSSLDFEKAQMTYHKRFGVFMETKEIYDGHFGRMAGGINNGLEDLAKFEKATLKSFAKGSQAEQTLKAARNAERLNYASHRYAHIGKMVALPGLVIGSEVYAALHGEAKWGEVGLDLAEAGAGFVPVVGTALDFKAWWTGHTLSGRTLSRGEQWASFGFGCVGIIADVGTLLGGVGYGLRVGITAARDARVVKNLANAGRFDSFLFKAGQKIGGAGSFLRRSGRTKALEQGEELLAVTRNVNRIDDLRRLKRSGNLTDAHKAELARLEHIIPAEGRELLTHNKFYRKGSELWLSVKGKIYKKTLPKSSVDAVEKVQTDLRAAEQHVGGLRARANELSGLSGTFNKEHALKQLESLRTSTNIADRPKYKELKGVFDRLEKAESSCARFRWSSNAQELQLAIEQERMVKKMRYVDKFVGYASKAGMGAAALMMLTAGHVGPGDVVKGAYNAAKPVAHVAGKVGDELFFKEHKVNDSMEDFVEDEAPQYVTADSSVEEQFAGAIAQGERKEYIEHQVRKGVSVDEVLRDHRDDEGFRQVAYEMGKAEVLADAGHAPVGELSEASESVTSES